MSDLPLTPQLAWLLVESATAAPSFRNSQPWWFLVRPDDAVIELHADPGRVPPGTDPDGRAAHISCGAALFNLRLTVTCASAEPVTRLLPDPADPRLLATVRLAGPHRPRARELDLYAALRRRHAGPVTRPGVPLSTPLMTALAEAAALEGATLFARDSGAVLATASSGPADWLRAGAGAGTGPAAGHPARRRGRPHPRGAGHPRPGTGARLRRPAPAAPPHAGLRAARPGHPAAAGRRGDAHRGPADDLTRRC